MKKITFIATSLSLMTLLSVQAKAQETEEKTKPETSTSKTPKFALSLNGGTTFSYTDVKPQKNGLLIGLGAAYFATPYLHINLDVQKGWLKGGEKINEMNIMASDNSFFTATVTGRFMPFGLIKKQAGAVKFLSGIYGGVGMGLISNSVTANDVVSAEFGSLGKYSGMSLMVPIEAGIHIPVAEMSNNKRILINLNYRVNLCMSDKIDGYVPIVAANQKNDAYNSLTAGVVFNF